MLYDMVRFRDSASIHSGLNTCCKAGGSGVEKTCLGAGQSYFTEMRPLAEHTHTHTHSTSASLPHSPRHLMMRHTTPRHQTGLPVPKWVASPPTSSERADAENFTFRLDSGGLANKESEVFLTDAGQASYTSAAEVRMVRIRATDGTAFSLASLTSVPSCARVFSSNKDLRGGWESDFSFLLDNNPETARLALLLLLCRRRLF